MAERTLLDITNSVLKAIGQRAATEIGETTVSLQVAEIVRDTYYEGLANRNWAHKKTFMGFDPYGASKPTHVIIPNNVKDIDKFNYDGRKVTDNRSKYEEVRYLTPEEFLQYTNQRNESNDNISVVEDVNGIDILIRTDVRPEYYTSFDQEYLIFDSYDSTVDSFLQKNKMQAQVVLGAEFTLEDDYVPDIPEVAFPWLLAESKSVAAIEINQDGNSKAEQQSRRQQQWLSQNNQKVGAAVRFNTFGRSPRKYTSYRRRGLNRYD